jgi:epoxyqueuosine reductase QueG
VTVHKRGFRGGRGSANAAHVDDDHVPTINISYHNQTIHRVKHHTLETTLGKTFVGCDRCSLACASNEDALRPLDLKFINSHVHEWAQ